MSGSGNVPPDRQNPCSRSPRPQFQRRRMADEKRVDNVMGYPELGYVVANVSGRSMLQIDEQMNLEMCGS